MLKRSPFRIFTKFPDHSSLTYEASSLFLNRRKKRGSFPEYMAARSAAKFWIDENWTVRQQLDIVIAKTSSLVYCNSLQDVSDSLLHKDLNALSIEQAALLVTLTDLSKDVLNTPWALSRINALIARIAKQFPKRYYHATPFAIVPFSPKDVKQEIQKCKEKNSPHKSNL